MGKGGLAKTELNVCSGERKRFDYLICTSLFYAFLVVIVSAFEVFRSLLHFQILCFSVFYEERLGINSYETHSPARHGSRLVLKHRKREASHIDFVHEIRHMHIGGGGGGGLRL